MSTTPSLEDRARDQRGAFDMSEKARGAWMIVIGLGIAAQGAWALVRR